jgi:hypothetical protein
MVLTHPPLEPAPGGVTVFEFVLLATAVAKAWLVLVERDYQTARKGGGTAIHEEIARLRRREWANKGRIVTIAEAGSAGYFFKQLELKRRAPRPDTIAFEVTRSGFLRAAELSKKGPNLRRLDAALARLCEPIAVAGVERDPVLVGWQVLPGRRLRLTVDTRWVPRRRFGRLAFPLPTQERTRVLPLYLFLHGIDLTRPGKISFDRLCARLGIARGHNAKRALERALKGVNDHLKKIDREALAGRTNYQGEGLLDPPLAIGMRFLDGDKVQFIAQYPIPLEERSELADAGPDEVQEAEPTDDEWHEWVEEQRREQKLQDIARAEGDWAAHRARLDGWKK